MPTHTYSYFPRRGACGKQTVVVYIHLQNTGCSVLACIARCSPDVLARLGSAIASSKALVDPPAPRLVIVRYEGLAAIEPWRCILRFNTPPVVYQARIKCTTGGVLSITLCVYCIYDCQFHPPHF